MPAACTGRSARQATKPRPIAPSATAAPTSFFRPNPRLSAPPCPIPAACATPRSPISTAPACTAKPSRTASPRRPSAPTAMASTKSSSPTNPASPVNAAHIRDTCGSCHGNVRLTRNSACPPTAWSASIPPSTASPARPATRPSPTAPVATASITSCRHPTPSPPSTPRTCPRPAASAIQAPARASPSARCTWSTTAPSRRRCASSASFICCSFPSPSA